MIADPTNVTGSDVAVLRAGQPLPEPWYSTHRRSLECDLCRDAVDALWLLSPHRPPDLGWGIDDGELCICRRCAEAVRPVPKPDQRHEPGVFMTTSTHGIATPTDHNNETRAALAARHLYEAEHALHDAHQSHVEVWIAAASDRLHQAVIEHLAAVHQQDHNRPATNLADTPSPPHTVADGRRPARGPANPADEASAR